MKKILVLASAALLAISCSDRCVIEGLFDNAGDESVVALVVDRSAQTQDTCYISEGKFIYECPASDTSILTVQIKGSADNAAVYRQKAVRVIPSKGKIFIDMNADTVKVTGSALTDTLNAFMKGYEAFFDDFSDRIAELTHEYPENEIEEAEIALVREIQGEMKDYALNVFKRNSGNAVGIQAIGTQITDITLEELDGLLADAEDFARHNETIINARKQKLQQQATSEGKPFVDFEGRNPAGDVARLSDFVGRGKYVLVDFWASWCGPCKAEIPNIKSLYEKYSSKGLVVLGVAVWDKDNSGSRKVMEQFGMEWNQIFVGEDTTPTDVYGIIGIPHIILFAPDGTIAKRDLRGKTMISTVSELFK